MNKGIYKNAVNISHIIISQIIQDGDKVVDATCGRGNDTLFLAGKVGEKGLVYAFDIQESAINSTRSLLIDNHLLNRVVLIPDSHDKLGQYIEGKVKACMFNLGYLPGGNHSIKTNASITLQAVKAVVDILESGGIITIVGYPGHTGGQAELDVLREYLSSLPQQAYEIWETRFINQVNNPPQIIVVQKL